MKDIVVVEIDRPLEEVAALHADPNNITKWMDDVARYEPLSGEQGMPGSTYRLIPKQGSMIFTARVVSRNLPNELRLSLEAGNTTVDVQARLSPLPEGRTKLVSEELFEFKGVWNKLFGLLARPVIRKAHRKHLEAFKEFAERR